MWEETVPASAHFSDLELLAGGNEFECALARIQGVSEGFSCLLPGSGGVKMQCGQV